MKQFIFRLLVLTTFLGYSNITSGQASYTKSLAGELWKKYRTTYILNDKGEFNIKSNNKVTTRLQSFEEGKEYIFIGIVDDCKDCKLSLELVDEVDFESPNSKGIDYQIHRSSSSTQTTIGYKFIAGKTRKGAFELFNHSNKSRFAYILILVKK